MTHYRRSNMRHAWRGRWKLYTIWGTFLLVVVSEKLSQKCAAGSQICHGLEYSGYLVFTLAVLLLVYRLWMWARPKDSSSRSFAEQPWEFDREAVYVTGKVEKIFDNSIAEVAKRRVTNWYRQRTHNSDPRNRFVHQRFLITSKSLKPKATILIEHNIDYGTVPLRLGDRIEISGQYLHTVDEKRGHFYGRIHRTHPPHGYIRVV